MSMKRFAFVFLLLVAMGFAFHQSILHFSLQLYLAHTAKRAGYSLSYSEIHAKPNQFTLIQPDLLLRKNRGRVQAKALHVTYAFHPFSRSLDLDIVVEEPEVELGAGSVNMGSLVSRFARSSSWLKINGHLKNEKGILRLKDSKEPLNLYFAIDHTWGSSSHAHYLVQSEDDAENNRMEFSFDDKGGFIHSKQVEAQVLTKLIHALFPKTNEWLFTNGILEGNFAFTLDNWHFTNSQGELIIEGASIQHSKSHIQANMQEILLQGTSNKDALFSLNFLKGTVNFSDNELYGTLRDLQGKIWLTHDQQLKLESQGIWNAAGQSSFATLEATSDTLPLKDCSMKLKFDHLDPGHASSIVAMRMFSLDSLEPHVDLNFINVRQREFAFAQRVLNNIDSNLNPLDYTKGTLNANFHLGFKNSELAEVKIDNLAADDISFTIKPWELAVGSDRIRGHFSFDLSKPNLKETVNAAIAIENGNLALMGFNFGLWNFTHIETSLEVRQGRLQASSASVQLAGLKGQAAILGEDSKHLMQVKLSGKVADLKPFVSERIQKGINQTLLQDEVIVDAELDNIPYGVSVLGSLIINGISAQKLPPIHFGCNIEQSACCAGKASLENQEKFLYSLKPEAIKKLSPISQFSLVDFTHSYLQKEIGFSGYTLHKGWIKAGDLPLEKFVSPFLFPDREFKLTGDANLNGHFDLTGIAISYNGKNFHLENDKGSMEIPLIRDEEAFFNISFVSPEYYGFLPIRNGSYFDKNSGLLFTDMRSQVLLEGDKVHFDEIEIFSNGVYFAGSIDVDYSSPLKGTYSVDIRSHIMEGSFSQIQHLLSHLEKPLLLNEIPLEGQLSFGQKGGRLFLDVQSEHIEQQAYFDCQLHDGKLACPNANIALRDLNINFSYDHQADTLEFNDLQGVLLLGKSESVNEYALHAKKINFTQYSQNIAEFDIALEDGKKEFIRFVGSTKSHNDHPEIIDFHFDNDLTHIGEAYPNQLELSLFDWKRVEHLQTKMDFNLNTLLQDIQKFSHSGLLFLSSDMLYELNHLKTIGGDFSLSLGFNGLKSIFEFELNGSDLLFEKQHIKNVHLSGYKKDQRWLIEQLQLDNFSMAAEIFKNSDLWKVDFLGIRYGKSLLIGLDGSYRHGDPTICAHVNLFEIDLDHLDEWEELKQLVDDLQPHGKLKGTGELVLKKQVHGEWSVDAHLETSVRDINLQGFHLKDADHLLFHLVSDKGWTLRDLKSSIVEGDQKELFFDLKEMKYHFDSQSLDVEDLAFSVDAAKLPWLGETLKNRFQDDIDDKTANLISSLKSAGTVKGIFDFHSDPSGRTLHLSLADGRYMLLGEERDLQNLTLDIVQDELEMAALCKLNQQPLWITARLKPSDPSHGEFLIAETALNELDKPALVINWKTEPDIGLVIEKISGYLAGMWVELRENNSNPSNQFALNLAGTMDIDGNLARQVMPLAISKAIDSLQIGKGYHLQGTFEIAKDVEPNEDREIRFFGALSGSDVELKGYHFQQLSAQVVLQPASLQLFELHLSDPAGQMHIAHLSATRNQNEEWHLAVPLINVYEMRPSLLKEIGKPNPVIQKPLIVKQLFIQDIHGVLSNDSSLQGHGILHFVNPQKKNLQNTIFAIPAEILTRIGLNLSVLTPVSGTVHFELQNGKIYLTKFKDVYSDGKISKFYLSSNSANSTIDLDGNLNVQVRFKQSTLLLKLVEMFTIDVKGNLKKPIYTLQRQKYLINQDLFTNETADKSL